MTAERDFWSRRRARVEAEAEADRAAREAESIAEAHLALEDKTDDEILAELKLPDPDSLKMGDDFKVFMTKAVPDRIRRRALRTLWRSNPVLANLDAMVDYGEDFTDGAMAVENIQTAYQVGKGMLKHVEEMARQAEERAAPPASVDVDEEGEQGESEEFAVAGVAVEDSDAPPAEIAPDMPEEPLVTPTPRRMKFTTQESAA